MKKIIPCTWMRGGTSKGGCFLESDLSKDLTEQDKELTNIYGGNDPSGREINGLGGGTSTTSKAVIISKRTEGVNAINYTFAQVDTKSTLIDRKGNCGNMSTVVGPFAIEKKLVDSIKEPITLVNIYNTNTNKKIVAHVPVKDGKVVYEGDYSISGVPGTASKIQLDFLDPGGAVTGKLLPTGNVVDILDVVGLGQFRVSMVDASNPLVFVKAEDLGIIGVELPEDIDDNKELLDKMLAIRETAAVYMGIAKNLEEAKQIPAIPKFCFVSKPETYTTVNNSKIDKKDYHLSARMLSMGKLHPTYAITGGICTAIAAKIPGTIVNEIVKDESVKEEIIIGHCNGTLSVDSEIQMDKEDIKAIRGTVFRTAKVLIRGEVEVDL
ncbi:3-methylitaconate isomerase [Apibacter muscae]|uniref:3-methylitaconate isomerase n=1 Tax=Apibacter muscae TaxID=2509004 RepID=A0A563DBY4_9FLAO|nr:PrpF domain-containing protein [Apibacter muscae]TWP27284.1 3-methylitaconate isomerase [Apibacter muscae]TWP28505.1 3-methylitaconate isomerase [Apibacter muscae]